LAFLTATAQPRVSNTEHKIIEGIIRQLLITTLLLIAAGPGQTQVLQVGVTPIAPLYTVSEQGVVGGILTDLLIQALDKIDMPYDIRVYPPKRLLRNIISGVASLTIGVKNNLQRPESRALYSDKPVYQLQLQIYSLASTPVIDRLEDLRGHNVGLVRGYQYGSGREQLEAVNNSGRIVDVSSHLSGLNLLSKKRIAYFLNYRQTSVAEDRAIRHYTLHTVDMYFIVSKRHPRAQQLMESLEQAHAKRLQ